MSIVDVKKYKVTHLIIRDDKIEQILVELLLAKFDLSIWLAATRSFCFACLGYESWQLGLPTLLLVYFQVLVEVCLFDVGVEGCG